MSENIYTIIVNQKFILEIPIADGQKKTLIEDIHSRLQSLGQHHASCQAFITLYGKTPKLREEEIKIFVEARELLQALHRSFCAVLSISTDVLSLNFKDAFPWDIITFNNGTQETVVSCLFTQIVDEKQELFKKIKKKQKELNVYLHTPNERPTGLLETPISPALIEFLHAFPHMPPHILAGQFRDEIVSIVRKHTFPQLAVEQASPVPQTATEAHLSPSAQYYAATRSILDSIRLTPLIEELKSKASISQGAAAASPMWARPALAVRPAIIADVIETVNSRPQP
jgi:hypothetical protein